jgi:hypothetical protein
MKGIEFARLAFSSDHHSGTIAVAVPLMIAATVMIPGAMFRTNCIADAQSLSP